MSTMDHIEFRPDREKYRLRCWINAFWGALPVNVIGPGWIAFALAANDHVGWAAFQFLGINALYLIIAGLYIPAWVANVRYEMTDEEVVVHKGVFGKIHKIVPYRTVTNVSITRGWLDRIWLGIGSVNIQTAGAGASSIAEEQLVGLTNFEEIRDAVVTHLRRYRADSGPALGGGTSSAREVKSENGEVAQEMLEELKAIRELLERKA